MKSELTTYEQELKTRGFLLLRAIFQKAREIEQQTGYYPNRCHLHREDLQAIQAIAQHVDGEIGTRVMFSEILFFENSDIELGSAGLHYMSPSQNSWY